MLRFFANFSFRIIIPLTVAVVLLWISPHQNRPFLISGAFDWVVRIILTIYCFLLSWAIGGAITGEWKKSLPHFEEMGRYPPTGPIGIIWRLFCILAILSGTAWAVYNGVATLLPGWITWRIVITESVVIFIGWGFFSFYIGWIKWYKETYDQSNSQ